VKFLQPQVSVPVPAVSPVPLADFLASITSPTPTPQGKGFIHFNLVYSHNGRFNAEALNLSCLLLLFAIALLFDGEYQQNQESVAAAQL
jgi:hypothetical protein